MNLQGVGRVIAKYGFTDDVGVNVLHRHFGLHSGEQVVGRRRNNSISIQPETYDADAIPYLYRFGAGTRSLNLCPLEFVAANDADDKLLNKHKEVFANFAFLEEFTNALLEYNLTETHGLAFLWHELGGTATVEHPDGGPDASSRALRVTPTDTRTFLARRELGQRQVMFQFAPELTGKRRPIYCSHCKHCGTHK